MNVTYADRRSERLFSGLCGLVTGAGSGIGRATAIALADHGMQLTLVGTRESLLHETLEEISHSKGHAIARSCDLSDADAVTRLARSVLEDVAGRLAILVHCAEMHSVGSIDQTSTGQFDIAFRTNVRTPFQLTQLLLPALRGAGGDIVFVNSSAALDAAPDVGPYAASNAALRALADTLRHEVSCDGVRVLNVYPGTIATSMRDDIPLADIHELMESVVQPADVAHTIVSALSLGTTTEVTELYIRPVHRARRSEPRKSPGWD